MKKGNWDRYLSIEMFVFKYFDWNDNNKDNEFSGYFVFGILEWSLYRVYFIPYIL